MAGARRGRAGIAWLLLIFVTPAVADDFYPLGRRHPVQGVFLSPPLTGPEVLPSGRWRLGWRLEESNTLNRGAVSLRSQVLLDTEVTRLAVDLARGLGGGWELRVELPWKRRWGGVLDRPIEVVERAVGQSNPLRAQLARNGSRLLLLDAGVRVIDQRAGASGWGDLEVGLVRGGVLTSGLEVSGEVRLALATGDRKAWLGSGGMDAAVVLRAGRGDRPLAWTTQIAWIDPADPFRERPGGLRTRRHLELSAGLRGRLTGNLKGELQLAWRQSAIGGSRLDEFEQDLWELAAGLAWPLGERLIWQVGLIENLVVAPGADVTLYSRFVFRP